MKKIKFLIVPLFCIIFSVNLLAHTAGGGTYEFVDEDKVVIFEENSALTEDEQQFVAERLVYGSPEDSGIQTYAWCWLTGHNFVYDTVTVVTHKKKAESPRCYEEIYNVETCTKCDHLEEELIGFGYIVCCPEE